MNGNALLEFDQSRWTLALDWTLAQLLRTRWWIQTVAVLMLYWHSQVVRTAYVAGHSHGFRIGRRSATREARQRSREAAYSLGYKHGRKDRGALKLVVDNEAAPVSLYPARHQARG